jgi:uncharacterized protein (DUF1499 family)
MARPERSPWRWPARLLGLLLLLPLLLLVAGQAGLLRGTPPADLGVREGRLKAPSSTQNSVSSQAGLWPGHPQAAYAQIEPLALRGSGTATLARLASLLNDTPGATLMETRADYLRAEFRSRWLGFVDDAEFWIDPAAGVIQVRSASRLGREDFGANRARIEALRARLAAGP